MTKRLPVLVRLAGVCVSRVCFASLAGLLVVLISASVEAQTFTVLYAFNTPPDSGFPTSAPALDKSGNLYGTTFFNGAYFSGSVFRIDPNGNESVLYSFTGGSDGALPYAGVIVDGQGNLYGTTVRGGDTTCSAPLGCGVVFKIDRFGSETVLHSFTAGVDGESPYGALARDRAGNLYGTTEEGGGTSSNYGTIFEVSSSGQETVLYRFKGKADGAFPFGALVIDGNGTLYGTTTQFGTSGAGTVFRRSASGQFSAWSLQAAMGESPFAGVVRDSAGNLYGVNTFGGAYSAGSIFKISPTGRESILYSFQNGVDGGTPYGSLIRDAAGNLYGTTFFGGISGWGTVFKLTTANQLVTLYSFTGGTDGGNPYGGLTMDAAGKLYGTASAGGATGNGVVFKIAP